MKPNAAMIFAAGFGTRMGDLTRTLPKPMLPLGGVPMIDHTIDLLRQAGIDRIVANTHYLPSQIQDHLASKDVVVCHEDTILETGGGLRAALPCLGTDPILTINPDAAWFGTNPVAEVIEAWQDDMSALLVCTESGGARDFDIQSGKLRRSGPFTYTGLQVIRGDRLHEIKQDRFSLNAYWDLLMASGSLHGHIYNDGWMDIGTPDGLVAANERLRR